MPYIEYDSDGLICGLYANPQPGRATDWLDHAEIQRPTEYLRARLFEALKVECNSRITKHYPMTTQLTLLARGGDQNMVACIGAHETAYCAHKDNIAAGDRSILLGYDVAAGWPESWGIGDVEKASASGVVSGANGNSDGGGGAVSNVGADDVVSAEPDLPSADITEPEEEVNDGGLSGPDALVYDTPADDVGGDEQPVDLVSGDLEPADIAADVDLPELEAGADGAGDAVSSSVPEPEDVAAIEAELVPHDFGGVMLGSHTETILLDLRKEPVKLVRAYYEERLNYWIGDKDQRQSLHRVDNDDEFRAEKLKWMDDMYAVLEAKLNEIQSEDDPVALANYRDEATGWPAPPVQEAEYEESDEE